MKTSFLFTQRIALLAALLLGGMLTLIAQTPGIPYQAYFMDTNTGYVPGEQIKDIPLANTEILLEFEVRNDIGEVEYTEQKTVTTDEFGLVSTVIGVDDKGVPVDGFNNINWNGKPKTLYTDIDFSNTGNQFEDHGKMPIIYIPSASAETATQLVYNNDGSYTYHNENGDQASFSVPQHGAGNPNTLSAAGNMGDLFVDDSTGNVYYHGGTSWVPLNTDTLTTVTEDTTAGTITYKDEEGTETIIDITSLVLGEDVTSTDGTITGTAAKAALVAMDLEVDESKFADIPASAITGEDVTSTDGTITGTAAKAALVAMDLEVDESKLTDIPALAIAGGTDGQVLTTNVAGDVIWETPATVTGADVTSTDGTITGTAAKAALVAMDLEVDESKLTDIPALAIAGGTDGQVLTTNVAGDVIWETPATVTGADVTSTDGTITGTAAGAAIVAMDLEVDESKFADIPALAIAGGTDGQVLTTNVAGDVVWAAPGSGADNLGNHTATQDVILGTHGINNGDTGNANEVLVSTGTGTDWVKVTDIPLNYKSVSGDYTLTADDDIVEFTGSAPTTFTPPSVADSANIPVGKRFYLLNTSASADVTFVATTNEFVTIQVNQVFAGTGNILMHFGNGRYGLITLF